MGCSAASILNTRHSQLKGVPIGFRIHRKVASGAHPGTVGDLEGTFSPVPTPRGDSRHGPLHEVNPGKSRVLVIPPGNPTSAPLPGTAFPRVSPRTAPAPVGAGEEAGGRAGWGVQGGTYGRTHLRGTSIPLLVGETLSSIEVMRIRAPQELEPLIDPVLACRSISRVPSAPHLGKPR